MNKFAESVQALWPHCPEEMMAGIVANADDNLSKLNITTDLRIAHFGAQISHESDGGVITHESLNYSHAARIHAVWPSRFSVDSAAAYVHDEKRLADAVYNGRMGNRPDTSDGFNFRGRGLLQITGRDSYNEAGEALGIDLVNSPDLAIDPKYALLIAAWEFKKLGCLQFCDADDVLHVTKRVNGGTNGLAERQHWLHVWKHHLGI
jgi:putative chitinase